jgi:prophage antirepressor-like protein
METSLVIKEFQDFNIQIYGTYEEPLFKAKDIGELLGIKNIRESIKNFSDKQKCDVSLTDAIGREQNTTFLSEQGLYKVLMKSRKPIAEKFPQVEQARVRFAHIFILFFNLKLKYFRLNGNKFSN